MKNKVGLTYLKLILILIVIGIVAGAIGYYILNIFKDENAKNLQADLLLVQAKIEMVKGNYSMNAENNPLKGYKLTELPEEISLQDFYDKSVISPEDYDKYFVLNNEALKECGLGELVNKYDGYFIVNYDDFEVIYTKGYENVNGLECYKLSELNKFNNPVNLDTVEASAGVADNVENSEEQAQTENQENTQGNVEENASESNAQNNEKTENDENTENVETEVVHCENVFIKMVKEKFPQKSLVVDINE